MISSILNLKKKFIRVKNVFISYDFGPLKLIIFIIVFLYAALLSLLDEK